jgi:hypothetical protein
MIKHARLAPQLQDVRATHTGNTTPTQTIMPNSGRCPSAYSCAAWHIPVKDSMAAMIVELVCVISL